MYPYDLNPLPCFQASVVGFIHPSSSTLYGSHDSSTFQGSTSGYPFPTVSQPSYTLVCDDGYSSQAPRISGTKSSRSSSHSTAGTSVRTPLSLSSDPYHQAKLRHRASTRHQERSQLPSTSAPASSLDTVPSFDAVVDNSASAFCHDPVFARECAPSTSSLVSPYNIATPNTNQNMLLSVDSLALPRETFRSTSPPTPIDQADIEYGQDRYGNKRCFYQCRFDLSGSPCNKWIVGDRTRVLRHLRIHHHLQTGPATPAACRWDKCTHTRPMKQENLSRHIVTHLGVKWKCPHCRRLFSRDDAVHRHIERMLPGKDISDAEVVPGREARALNESQFMTNSVA